VGRGVPNGSDNPDIGVFLDVVGGRRVFVLPLHGVDVAGVVADRVNGLRRLK